MNASLKGGEEDTLVWSLEPCNQTGFEADLISWKFCLFVHKASLARQASVDRSKRDKDTNIMK